MSVVSSFEPAWVDGDFTRLVQCVSNVLTNAAKYTEPGGEIRIQTRLEGPLACLEIVDNGVGISPQLLPRVFDLFVQSDRAIDRSQGGLGIGLSVVKRLVQMHGGEVTARSDGEGHGATFAIRLPRIERPEASAPNASDTDVPYQRVLIVDDNADAANSLAQLLTLQGQATEVAYSGRQALERLKAFRPEFVLLDLGLPEMDGYEVARRIRAMPEFEGIRLVALSGYGQPEDRHRTQAAGFDGHLVKPVDIAVLAKTLAGHTEHAP
jgi:CheY-like chemotaxis protein/anti-sigma regulatory factor (Ser/Thr protein kinase)